LVRSWRTRTVALYFKAGFTSDYTVGEVSDKFKQDYRVWIACVRMGLYALFAKCRHEDKFKCHCQGSGYYKSGLNFEGPAPDRLIDFR
jgi:cytochrome b6-f complex iron-sulfur subunit